MTEVLNIRTFFFMLDKEIRINVDKKSRLVWLKYKYFLQIAICSNFKSSTNQYITNSQKFKSFKCSFDRFLKSSNIYLFK